MTTTRTYSTATWGSSSDSISSSIRLQSVATSGWSSTTSGNKDEISLAYAITIHKSRGSEFPAGVIPLATQHYMLLQRNLVHRGITRGKRLLVLIGQKKALGIAVRNDGPQRRYSVLLRSLSSEGGQTITATAPDGISKRTKPH
jgi:hypothetical protein